jgi:ABC-type glycerol-3-phosphate transport system permease component
MKNLFFILYILSGIGFVVALICAYTTYDNPIGTNITTLGQAQKAYFSNYWGIYIPLVGFGLSFSFFGCKFWGKS